MVDYAIGTVPPSVENGVYCGFAQVNDGPVYKMVMSLGFNPFFGNSKRSLVSSTDGHFQTCFLCFLELYSIFVLIIYLEFFCLPFISNVEITDMRLVHL